jgi:hypothetical protein
MEPRKNRWVVVLVILVALAFLLHRAFQLYRR